MTADQAQGVAPGATQAEGSSSAHNAAVEEALARLSIAMTRALLRIEANARRSAGAEAPPHGKAAAIPPDATVPSSHPSTADAPLTNGAAPRA
jgi:hypothetical protein